MAEESSNILHTVPFYSAHLRSSRVIYIVGKAQFAGGGHRFRSYSKKLGPGHLGIYFTAEAPRTPLPGGIAFKNINRSINVPDGVNKATVYLPDGHTLQTFTFSSA